MLDDLKYIHEKDAQDALGIASKQLEQLTHEYNIVDWKPKKNAYDNVVYAGMGGSSLAALLGQSWPGFTVPFEVCREYKIPTYVSKKTLFIACSYSGNTEETLTAVAEAGKRGATVIVIAGGGKLEEYAKETGAVFVRLPKAVQPRYAVLYNLVAIVQLLDRAGLCREAKPLAALKSAQKTLTPLIESWLPTVPTKSNPAKQLAKEIMGKSLVVYAGPFLSPAAYKWKISANENAKNIAWWNTYPEFNHNEFIGWSSHPTHKPYCVVDLLSDFDHPQINKRFSVSSKLLSGKRPEPHVVKAQGKTAIEQLLWTVMFGDFVTLYLGLLNGVNPSPVALVEKLKEEL